MSHIASLTASIVVAWGLTLAPPASGQESEDAYEPPRDPLCMGDPCTDVKWEFRNGCVALANSTSKIMSVDAVFLGGGGQKFAIQPGETRRLELLVGCVKSMGALKSVDIAYIKPPQLPAQAPKPPSRSETPPPAQTGVGNQTNKAARRTGTVKFYNAQKGYGFITPDDGGVDVFVHYTVVQRSGIGALVEGMRISFEVVPESRGTRAVNLQPIGDIGTAPAELPSSSSEMSPPAKTDARSDPVISAADGTPEGEWSICSTGPSVSMKAIEACTRLIAIGESIPPSRRAEVFFRRGQLKEQLLSLKSPDKTEQAEILDDYNAAIGLDQTRPSVYLARALLTVNMGGDGKRAIADLSEVIRLDPGIARAYLVRGLQYAKQGDLDGALTDVSKSIELAPDSVAYESRAEIFLKKDKMASAFADLDAAVRLAPKNSLSADILKEKRDRIGRPLAKVYAERGRVAAQNGDTDLAVLDFNSALEYDPDNWRANYDRGAIYLQRGELDKARADIRAATQQFTRTKPSDWPVEIATAHVWLGEIYEKKRLLSAALLEYDEALKAPQYLNDAEGVRARADRIRSQAK